jgi:hypothetical protein
LASGKCKKEECPLSLGIIGEIKVVKPVYVSQKLLVRLSKGVKMLLYSVFSGLIERNFLKFFEISLAGL